MEILKKDFKDIDTQRLIDMDGESELLVSLFTDALKGVGEVMQVVDVNNVSPETINNIGSMLEAIGHVIEDTTANKMRIALAMKE